MLMLMAQDINRDASQPAAQDSNGTVPAIAPSGVTPPVVIQPKVIVPNSPPPQPNPINPLPDPSPTPVPPPQPIFPPPPAVVAPTPQAASPGIAPPQPPIPPVQAKPSFFKRLLGHKKLIAAICLVLFFVVAVGGAYGLGKGHEKIIIQAPPPQPISLPPQTVVVTDCKPGRGKQYILPKDIPLGPVYDVVNNKVIAVEYNFRASDLFVNGNRLSDTLIPFFKGNYKTEYFVITPGTLQAGQNASDTPVNVAIFVVTKDDANKISC